MPGAYERPDLCRDFYWPRTKFTSEEGVIHARSAFGNLNLARHGRTPHGTASGIAAGRRCGRSCVCIRPSRRERRSLCSHREIGSRSIDCCVTELLRRAAGAPPQSGTILGSATIDIGNIVFVWFGLPCLSPVRAGEGGAEHFILDYIGSRELAQAAAGLWPFRAVYR